MKLQLMFLLIDAFLFLAYGYLWLRHTFVHALRRKSKSPN